ncbi:MAG: ABC transporter substrate-binding protein [Streptosporangiaceae bacterium]
MTAGPIHRMTAWQISAGLGALSLALLTACSGGGGSASAGGSASTSAAGQTLTIAVTGPPVSMDPSHADNGNGLYPMELAYDPLIYESDSGTLTPGLATSWKYVGTGNKQFQLTIRKGVKFSDGQPVTAQAVANSLNYFPKGSGPSTADLAGVTAAATGPDTVTLTSKTPDPVFPQLFSQDYLAGDIISPKGLANPKSLTATPSGAGPYVLDTSATVADEQYTFTPNKYYYDPGRVHYQKIVIKVITQPTAELSALQTGQINLMFGSAQQVSAAKSAGLQVKYSGAAAWDGVFLMDRGGKPDKALASVKVRQALNYAVNRPAIAAAVFGVLGKPDDQPVTPGWDEYVPSLANYYTYNVAKARQLLTQAGYPHGFTMTLEYAALEAQTQEMVQAFAQQMAAIGVTVQLKAEPTITALAADLTSGKYAAVSLEWGGQPMFLQVGEVWLPTSVINPYHVASASFISEFDTASAAPPSQVNADMANLAAVTVQDAYTVPIAEIESVEFASTGLKGLPTQAPGGHLDLLSLSS